MLLYLLNTTAIWLSSLVLFDVFLRRESYHGYNRLYLLLTLLLGALLPLWQWQYSGTPLAATMALPVQQVIAAKQNIVNTAGTKTPVSWEQWLKGIYLFGAVVVLSLLIIDMVKLLTVYRNGTKSRLDSWTIIETGTEHAPFSLLNTMFVCSTRQYSPDEWNMIVIHEQRHTTLHHFADLLLMHTARVVFWFHPLVYCYNKRLLLVHEYQADTASTQQPHVYGRFLAEQAILQASPSITHSFNRSPIKNRIIMLTRRSSAASRIKMLVFIPLALVCTVCFSKNSFSPKQDDNIQSSGVVSIKDVRNTGTPKKTRLNHKYHDVEVYRTVNDGLKMGKDDDSYYQVRFYGHYRDSLFCYMASWGSNEDMDKADYKWENDTLASIRLYNSQSKKEIKFQVFGNDSHNGPGKKSGMIW